MSWFLLLVFVLPYAWFLYRAGVAWKQLPIPSTQPASPIFFSVLVPIRNEAETILALLHDLEKQHYPRDKFEVILIDDHSEDNTAALVHSYMQQSALPLKVLFLASFPEMRQKKAAIQVGVSQAKGQWIVCTDGDCRVSSDWLSAYNQIIQEQHPLFVSGPVVLQPAPTFFEKLQALEFSALIGVGAASIGLQKPTMCNGANLAYEKTAFYAVNGYAGNEEIASGDDEFLMHKIHDQFAGKVVFLKDQAAIVRTSPVKTVSGLLQQRVRWASKWKHYQSGASKLLAVWVTAANLSLWVIFISALADNALWFLFFSAVVLKLAADVFLLLPVVRFFKMTKLIFWIGLLQIVYVPYTVLTALLGLKGSYRWKGRKIS